MEGMSEREYSTHSGLSRGAIQKARCASRLVVYSDGSINAAASDVRRSEMVDHIVIAGGPDDPSCWDKLTALLGRTWACANGAVMVMVMVIGKPNFTRRRNAYRLNARASGRVAGDPLCPRPVGQSFWQIDQMWVGCRTAELNKRLQRAVRHRHDRHPASLMPGHRCLERSRKTIQTRRQPIVKTVSGFDAA